jgi:hypothetical protein
MFTQFKKKTLLTEQTHPERNHKSPQNRSVAYGAQSADGAYVNTPQQTVPINFLLRPSTELPN